MLSFLKVSKHYNIDPEEVWNLIIELGSFSKVSLNLANRGILNQKNSLPFTTFILQRAVWRWIVDNPDKAYEILKSKVPDLTEEYWEQFIVSKAYTVHITINHSRERFENWLKERKLEKYLDYRKSRYFRQRRNP